MIDPADLRDVFDRAASLPPQDRAAFLAQACGDDGVLRREVERLLAADARAGSVFDSEAPDTSAGAVPGADGKTRGPALAHGDRLGPYVILGPLGAGGMGEVYRARDPRLNREIAIKVLPADRLADDGRRRRFVQEAQAASALNHPHIITIHEIESAGDRDFIVMEFVRGKSLDALISRQGMRLSEVLRIAIPVADALAAAHARGIIHRDLKPANVMVGSDGAVKVLDFGLAKLMIGEATPDGETATHLADAGLSVPGAIAGTAAYMSPEQAVGEKVDTRSDIFSFGAMLYEMVTGQRAFAGTSTADTLSAVIRAQPKSPTAVVAGVPGDLEKIILRCLRKDPQRRFQHIDDAKVALQEVKEDSESGSALPVPVQRRGRWPLPAALVGSVIVVSAVALYLLRPPRVTDLPAMRIVPLTTLAGVEVSPTFSPDATQVAFAWDGAKDDNYDIYVKIVGSTELRQLTTDPSFDFAPSWSPDGRQIAFLRYQQIGPEAARIHLISPLGGAVVKLSDFPARGFPWDTALAWSPDGRYIAAGRAAPAASRDASGIYLVPVEGGEPRLITRANEPSYDHAPAFSLDGRHLAYVSCRSPQSCDVYIVDLDAALGLTGSPRRLTAHPTDDIVGNHVEA